MRTWLAIPLLLGALTLLPGGTPLAEEREILFYRNPMNPEVTSPEPAKDWMGMDYIPVYADEVSGEDGMVVRIDPALVQNLGVRTEPVSRGRLWRRIDAVGNIGYDEARISHIHMRSEGWIEDLRVHFVGERFAAGDVLFEIYAPALVNAQEEFLQALRTGQNTLIASSRERLHLLGVDELQVRELERSRKVRPRITVRAPRDGVVTDLNARHGMFVTPAMEVMSLADLSSLWLLVEVPERQSAWVAVGQPVELRLPALPGELFEGRIDYLYPGLDARTRTLRARVQLDNPGERFRPDMFASVRIFAGPRDDVLSIPRAALIRTGRAERVIVAEGEGRFRAVEVSSGMESGDWVEIREGLEEGERVVVSGQFLLDSEASIKASASRLRGAQTDAEPVVVEPAPEGMATITAVKADARVLTLDHEPIEALGWPAMVMDLDVGAAVDLEGLAVGDRIHFTLEQGEDGGYRIGSIHVLE
ncbi:MAG: efflux RND transporter periplasmic adaptor subunit [Gammaproteobacteria bacterium]|nr:efflux RND transporter periplasmic adaptor subunit [Gammaproteobacteria bacterium]